MRLKRKDGWVMRFDLPGTLITYGILQFNEICGMKYYDNNMPRGYECEISKTFWI